MNIEHQVREKIRAMCAIPAGVLFNPLAALDKIAEKVVMIAEIAQGKRPGLAMALILDRTLLRRALCGLAFEYGLRDGKLEDIAVLEWPAHPPDPDLEELAELAKKAADKPKIEIARPKLVSLH